MELKNHREKIDETDKKIVTLLAKRLKIVKEVAIYKKKNNIFRIDKKREKEIILSKKEFAKKYYLREKYIEELFKRIIKESHIVEKEIIDKKRS